MTADAFLPSRHGCAFPNAWPDQAAIKLPTPFGEIGIGNVRGELCGGMAFAALDYWLAGLTPALERPGSGDALYAFIVDRLIDSWHVTAGVAQDLDRGLPVPIGVVTVASRNPKDLGLNHQVLATGSRTDGSLLTLRVYDPNCARRDDITIALDTAAPAKPIRFDHNLGLGGRTGRGFFEVAYEPRRPG
jgi:hypothetical protein